MIERAGGAAGPRCPRMSTWLRHRPVTHWPPGERTNGGSSTSWACLDHEYRALHCDVAGAFQGYLALISTPASYSQLRRTKTNLEAGARLACPANADRTIVREYRRSHRQKSEARLLRETSSRAGDYVSSPSTDHHTRDDTDAALQCLFRSDCNRSKFVRACDE
jgi:hypothetical protein